MHAPSFWSRPSSLPAFLLRPVAAIYGAVAGWRMGRTGAKSPVPVICIGNLVAGGAGKTPTAIAIIRLLRKLGRRPVVLTRGYGGTIRTPTLIDPARQSPAETGDEPRLLAAHAPVIVSPDRVAGAQLAAQHGDVIVMDDGLQNPSLAKDFSFAVVDAGAGLGNGLCLPAGPLRAPLEAQRRHVGAVLMVGEGVVPAVERLGLPLLRARLIPQPAMATAFAGRPVLAFAGIGRPQKFYDTLREAGADIRATREFPDHHPFDAKTLKDLMVEADRLGTLLVTTEKDRARMDGILPPHELERVLAFPVKMAFADREAVLALLRKALSSRA